MTAAARLQITRKSVVTLFPKRNTDTLAFFTSYKHIHIKTPSKSAICHFCKRKKSNP
jgi:hypothetical protein